MSSLINGGVGGLNVDFNELQGDSLNAHATSVATNPGIRTRRIRIIQAFSQRIRESESVKLRTRILIRIRIIYAFLDTGTAYSGRAQGEVQPRSAPPPLCLLPAIPLPASLLHNLF